MPWQTREVQALADFYLALREEYQQLAQRFAQLEQEAEQGDNIRYAVTDKDFFSFQPFWFELNQIDIDACRLYPDASELKGSETFIVALADHLADQAEPITTSITAPVIKKLCRVCGDDRFYHSFFHSADESDGKIQSRYQLYTKGMASPTPLPTPEPQCVPIAIERLKRDADGKLLWFQRIDQYSAKQQSYDYQPDAIVIDEVAYNVKEAQQFLQARPQTQTETPNQANGCAADAQPRLTEFSEQLKVCYQAEVGASAVERIDSLTQQRCLYQAGLQQQTLPALFAQAEDALIQALIRDVARLDREALNIQPLHCALFEYTLQGPLPPTLALIQEKEVQMLTDEHPLLWLNAPDAELFTETGLAIEFGHGRDGKHAALYEAINAKLDALEYEQQEQLIVEFYLRLCQSLNRHPAISRYLPLNQHFLFTARDFELGNEEEFLQKLLAPAQWQKIHNEIMAFERQYPDD